MSRYLGPLWRKSRRLNWSLLENEKEFSRGKKRNTPPGINRFKRRKKESNYSKQLKEKQKLCFLYSIKEKQLYALFAKTKKEKTEELGQRIIVHCESRLDNLVYRSGIASTRRFARQLVSHGHFLVNDKGTKTASYRVSVGQKISLKKKDLIEENKIIKENLKKNIPIPDYLEIREKKDIIYLREPSENDREIKEIKKGIDTSLIVEWYNRKI